MADVVAVAAVEIDDDVVVYDVAVAVVVLSAVDVVADAAAHSRSGDLDRDLDLRDLEMKLCADCDPWKTWNDLGCGCVDCSVCFPCLLRLRCLVAGSGRSDGGGGRRSMCRSVHYSDPRACTNGACCPIETGLEQQNPRNQTSSEVL